MNHIRINTHNLHQLFWECTLRCNLNCKHCGSDCSMQQEVVDMPFEDFLPTLQTISRNIKPKNVLIVITGGEPLMREDLAKCGKSITKLGFAWGTVSNGLLLTANKLSELIDAGLKTIAISLDGFEDDHNWIRGHSKSFEKSVEAIRNLNNSPRKIMWDVITCVNQNNIKRLDEFCDFLISIGVRRWRIFTVFPAGRAIDEPSLFLSKNDFIKMLDFIVRTKAKKSININYGCEGYLGKYEMKVRDYPFFCQSGINVASILSDGSISGCLSIRSNYYQGNIYKDDFWQIWSEEFKVFRNKEWAKKGKCSTCSTFEICQGGGMHLRDDSGEILMCNFKDIISYE